MLQLQRRCELACAHAYVHARHATWRHGAAQCPVMFLGSAAPWGTHHEAETLQLQVRGLCAYMHDDQRKMGLGAPEDIVCPRFVASTSVSAHFCTDRKRPRLQPQHPAAAPSCANVAISDGGGVGGGYRDRA